MQGPDPDWDYDMEVDIFNPIIACHVLTTTSYFKSLMVTVEQMVLLRPQSTIGFLFFFGGGQWK